MYSCTCILVYMLWIVCDVGCLSVTVHSHTTTFFQKLFLKKAACSCRNGGTLIVLRWSAYKRIAAACVNTYGTFKSCKIIQLLLQTFAIKNTPQLTYSKSERWAIMKNSVGIPWRHRGIFTKSYNRDNWCFDSSDSRKRDFHYFTDLTQCKN